MDTVTAHTNFGFLASRSPKLHNLARLAERYFADDPSTALIKLRQFGEVLALQFAAYLNVELHPRANQAEIITALRDEGNLNRQAIEIFHKIRKIGNDATHKFVGTHAEALTTLQIARALGLYYYHLTVDKSFNPGPFIPPADPKKQAAAVAEELAELKKQLEAAQLEKAQLQALAADVAAKAAQAEAQALIAAEEKAAWEALASESEQKLSEEKRQQEFLLEQLRTQAAAKPQEELNKDKTAAGDLKLQLDEQATRAMIDDQLRQAGWDADTVNYRYAKGVRPQKNRNMAIAEWPTKSGPADYALFAGLTLVAVVEAKRKNKNVKSAIEQAERYSEGIQLSEGLSTPAGPWQNLQVPFVFSTNGRGFLRQLREFSGIWFRDVRLPTNHARALEGWYTPDGLTTLLKKDVANATVSLQQEELEYLGLRPYQNEAIKAVEDALAKGREQILVAMATGTGKTRTAIGLIYRLLKSKRFHRILFLTDRTALGEQTHSAFKDVRVENLQTFADIYEVRGLGDLVPDSNTRVHLATVQALVHRCLYSEDVPPVDQYDCIIVDECHRGYNLDRDMSEAELAFRSEEDYISKYRRILDHFDAVSIGLTATPALHTTEIFGNPAFAYSYPQAVVDGYLVDHEPPIQIVTALAEDGITYRVGEPMQIYHVKHQQLDLFNTPDEVVLELESFNRRVLTESFNEVVCEELARQIDPDLEGKTLIFCANDVHADMVVRLLKEAMDERYGGISDKAIRKVTGASDRPSELIRRYKNEAYPSIAVTVDLLSTGIDVPKIVNLVFLRRVRSRILYEQMVGRATRLCPEIGKTSFRIFDAVQLYEAMQDYTEMKPVVTQPTITYAQLAREIQEVPDPAAKQEFLNQLVVKIRRKRLDQAAQKEFETLTGMSVSQAVNFLRGSTPEQAMQWLDDHPTVAAFLDTATGEGTRFIVSEHKDELRRVESGYGPKNLRPADYLEEFQRFLSDNMNSIPALLVVTQRPRDLTRGQLKELARALQEAGFSEASLKAAWRDTTNAEIAASIIGFVRQKALGSPLVPYDQRVDQAAKKLLASHTFSDPQRKWLERIVKQMKVETVVDKESLDRGQFKEMGGYNRLNKIFDGKVEALLGDLLEAVWEDDAA